MGTQTRVLPELRFSEFTDEWRPRKLSYFTDFQEGPGIMAVDFKSRGVPLIRLGGLSGQKVTLEGCNFLDPEKVAKKWEHFRLKSGDMLLSSSASLGTISEVDQKASGGVAYTGIIRFRPVESISTKDFLKQILNSLNFQRQVAKISTGGTIHHFGPTHLKKMIFPIPSLDEQQKIADFLTAVDGKITAIEKRVELLQKYKKGVMQQIFSQKIRFKDENGNNFPDWTPSTYKDLINPLGKTARQSSEGKNNGNYPFFDNSTKAQSRFVDEYDFDNEAIIANTGGTAFFDYYSGRFAAMSDCFVFSSSCKTKYLYFRLKYIESRIDHTGFTGSGMRHLDRQYLYNLKEMHPVNMKEQQKIADFLTGVDNKIAQEQDKLKNAKQFKKALLQRMFV